VSPSYQTDRGPTNYDRKPMGYGGLIDKARPPAQISIGGPQDLAASNFKMTPFHITKENPFKETKRYDGSQRSLDLENEYG
jgi:hypothetical protein